jgi:glycosyltransferase involved in cell wall biosynthesis
VRAALPQEPLDGDELVALAAGTLGTDDRWAISFALRALPLVRAKIPSARLVVAGREGNHTAALRALAAELDIGAVSFLGTRSDVADLLCAADVFVLPTRREGFPGSVLEAMALEAPIVASAIPAVAEAVVSGEHALLVPPDDPGALASAIVGTLSAPEEARRRTLAAHARFHDHFTIDRAADGMAAFYEAALSP